MTDVPRASGESRRTGGTVVATSEPSLGPILENIDESVYVVADIDGPFADRLEFVGQKRRGILGYPPGDFSNPDLWRRIIHPDDRERFRLLGRQVVQTKRPAVREYRVRHNISGEYRWMEDRVKPCLDETGNLLSIIGVVRDVTDRRLADEALRESQEKFLAAFENAPIGMALVDLNERFTQVNKALCDILGYSKRELLRSSVSKVTHPQDQDKAKFLMREARRGNLNKFRLEKRYIRADGQVVWGRLAVSIIHDQKGKPCCQIAQLEDVTEAKQATEELLKLRKAVNASSDAVFMTDRDGNFTFVNPAFTNLYGYAAEELIGKATPGILKNGRDRESYGEFWQTLLEKKNYRAEVVNVTRDGRPLSVEVSKSSVLDEGGEIIGLLGLHRDNTHRKREEEERRRLAAQFSQARKMEAVGLLAGGVAHDFNNMLSVILGHAELALAKLGPETCVRGDLDEIVQASLHSAQLTRQLLAFARKQTANPRVLNLNEEIGRSERMLARLLGEEVQVEVIPGKHLWPVKIDPVQLDQVLNNLAVNSRDAMPEGGRIVIETHNIHLDKTYCDNHPGSTPGPFVCVTFRDTGRGMDSETLGRVFEPFFTTKEKGGGTGLGLATVYGIIKQNNGYIEVSSRQGQGTEFKLFLQRCEGTVEAAGRGAFADVSLRGTETVLVVEDEPSISEFCRQALERAGFSVLAASSPLLALRLAGAARRQGREIQVLLTDVVMKAMSGKEVSQRLRDGFPDVKTIFMSGYPADVIGRHGVLEPSVDFLQKPFTTAQLLGKIRETLDRPWKMA